MTETREKLVQADVSDGALWLETPQTSTALESLFKVLDAVQTDDPGWQPDWVLCGPAGTGKSALIRRFANQAQRAASCDAVREAEMRYADDMRTPKLYAPGASEQGQSAWDRYREFERMGPAERVRRFGLCPHVCRPVRALPEEVFKRALAVARNARPVGVGELVHRHRNLGQAVQGRLWSERGPDDDRLRRTSLFFIDGADRLTLLSDKQRATWLAELRAWPEASHIRHPVTFVLVGRPELADAVSACGGEVARIELPAMDCDGPDGAFGQVCGMVFGTRDPAEVAALHRNSKGAIGPLLAMARLKGLKPPYSIQDGEVLRLPAPDEG